MNEINTIYAFQQLFNSLKIIKRYGPNILIIFDDAVD